MVKLKKKDSAKIKINKEERHPHSTRQPHPSSFLPPKTASSSPMLGARHQRDPAHTKAKLKGELAGHVN